MSRKTRSYAIKGLAEGKPRDVRFFNKETLAGEMLIDLFINPFIEGGPREPEHAGGDGLVVL
jgi:hypothetical protein